MAITAWVRHAGYRLPCTYDLIMESYLGGCVLGLSNCNRASGLPSRPDRARFPKDYGFHVYAEFGPELRIPRTERIKEVFPKLSDDSVAEWIADFKQVDELIWRVASCGGASKLGHTKVADVFSQQFAWLSGMGLKTALSRSDYFAWHEGYDKVPPDPARLTELFGSDNSV